MKCTETPITVLQRRIYRFFKRRQNLSFKGEIFIYIFKNSEQILGIILMMSITYSLIQ